MTVRKIITLISIVLSTACASDPSPSLVAGPVAAGPPPPPEPSTISVPIRASLASLLPELEARVPKTFADTHRERGIDVRYEVARDPIRLNMAGASLHATTKVRYALEACRGRFPCVSCGFKEARREADITLQTKLDWDGAWRLRSVTRPLPVSYPKPCEVTWFDIDVTRRFVAPVVDDQLDLAAKTIDRNTPSLVSLGKQAKEIWSALQIPVEIAPRTWLTFEPAEVALSPVTGSGLDVTSTLSLKAMTRIVVGEKPQLARRPLPALRPFSGPAAGLRVPFDLELPYEDASRLATRELAGKTYKVNGKPLAIESLKVLPAPNGKVLVEAAIDYRGGALRNYRGIVYLEGTPRFDAATATIVVPDLDYSLASKRGGVLLRAVERTAHQSIRNKLRESARFPIRDRLDAIRAELTTALTRRLAPGVELRGRATEIVPVRVTAMAGVLVVRVIATGDAEILLHPA